MSYLNVYMGNGDGTFATSPYFAEDFWLGAFAAGDFNEDGKTDLAYGEENADAVGIVLSNGDGTFSGAPSPLTGDLPGPLVVADYNGDEIADIATVTADTNHASAISVMLGNGDGTFTVQNFGTTTYPSALAAGDFNGDGFADLIYIQAITGNAAAAIEFGEETSTATGTLSAVQIVGTGTHTVQAVYAGDNNYAVSPAGSISLTAAMVSPTLTLTATPMNSTYGGQVALTATLSPATVQNQGTDGESITFSSGLTVLGSAALRSGVASLNVTSLSAGVDSLAATYPGDANFTGSSGTVAETVTGVSDFSVGLSAPSVSVAEGQSATLTITATPINGFNLPLNFLCSGMPALSTCTFAPATVTPSGGAVSTTLTIATTPTTTSMLREFRGITYSVVAMAFLMALPFGTRRRLRGLRSQGGLFLLLLALAMIPLAGCASSPQKTTTPGTPVGSSQVTIVVSTAGSVQHTAVVTLNVTN